MKNKAQYVDSHSQDIMLLVFQIDRDINAYFPLHFLSKKDYSERKDFHMFYEAPLVQKQDIRLWMDASKLARVVYSYWLYCLACCHTYSSDAECGDRKNSTLWCIFTNSYTDYFTYSYLL